VLVLPSNPVEQGDGVASRLDYIRAVMVTACFEEKDSQNLRVRVWSGKA